MSPAFKKTKGKIKENTNEDNVGEKRSPLQDLNNSISQNDAEDGEFPTLLYAKMILIY